MRNWSISYCRQKNEMDLGNKTCAIMEENLTRLSSCNNWFQKQDLIKDEISDD